MTDLDIPDDWYRSAYPPEMDKLPWAQKTSSEVDRLITMLKPGGEERILDLGCGTGRHALELARRGFSVVGVELLEANVEVAKETAEAQSFKAPPPNLSNPTFVISSSRMSSTSCSASTTERSAISSPRARTIAPSR